MKLFAQIIGLIAVATYLLSYQMKRRRQIILVNATSSMLYVLQYVMLGAFEGAVIDVLSMIATVTANNKDKQFIKNHTKLVFAIMNLSILIAGLALYKNIFSLFPIAGAIFQTSAFWISEEKKIRFISFLGSPFWLVYNIVSGAYGSAIGSLLALFSIGIAIYRYDIRKQK